MKYNPEIHHRKSIRLKGYDYSQKGFYFITLCAQHRTHFFGCIDNDTMILNDAGNMLNHWYYELENKFANIKCHEMVIMPNHFHCIIEITPVGADLCVCPEIIGQTRRSAPTGITVGECVQWFKTMTTNYYIHGVKNNNWLPFDHRLWQRNYWEHIIRDENDYYNIAEYIINNPKNWDCDKLNEP